MTEHLSSLMQRDLDTLAKEINQYTNEEDLWKTAEGINNCAGNLCLHICGNLKHFIGAVLGNSGYVRERDREFNDKNVPRDSLLTNIEETKKSIADTFAAVDTDSMEADYPIEVFGHKMKTGFFLIHLHGHMNYHLGQVNYHRRLLTSS